MIEFTVGRVYRAKRPGNSWGLVNDRQIKWISLTHVQYDSPSVKVGRRLPMVPYEQFKNWAARDVTDELPVNEWAAWKRGIK